ncbi:transmembrane amino acid transporter protein-domain-containing protein [Gongronella butleri]|nr:transmembrane amino acid transporter protein-domain-containing protein [Gongronella butleri]
MPFVYPTPCPHPLASPLLSQPQSPVLDQIKNFGSHFFSLLLTVIEDETPVNFSHGIDREKQGSSFLAYFNVVCVVAGTGALSLPYALKQGGWIDTGIILIRCLYHNGKTRLSSYQEVAQDAFGKVGNWVAFFFTFVILIGVPCVYMMLAGLNLNSICAGTSAELTPALWTVICCCIVGIPFVFFRSLKEVGVLSAFGTLATLITIIIFLVEAVRDEPNQTNAHHDVVIWNQFPVALSTIVFSFGGNPVYANVEAGMKRPQDWNKVVFAALASCVAMYALIAIPGYYVYGSDVKSPAYSSLPNSGAKVAAEVIITIHVILAAPILLTSLALDLEKLLRISSYHHSKLAEFGLRFALRISMIVVVAVIAIFVPDFGDFLSLLGAFSNCALVLIFPVLFYFKLTGFRNKPFYEWIAAGLIIILGIVGLIFGSWSAIDSLKAFFATYQP